MEVYFVDTGYWIALIDENDDLASTALYFSERITSSSLYTSEMVLTEVLNYFSKAGTTARQAAVHLIREILNNQDITVVPQTSTLFLSALTRYADSQDKHWSHTDCASFEIMREKGITQALAHDKHFIQAGFHALMRSEN